MSSDIDKALDEAFPEVQWKMETEAIGTQEPVLPLSLAKPNKVDQKRVDDGDWYRAGGDAICEHCGFVYYDHPPVPHFLWLRRLCNGNLIKL